MGDQLQVVVCLGDVVDAGALLGKEAGVGILVQVTIDPVEEIALIADELEHAVELVLQRHGRHCGCYSQRAYRDHCHNLLFKTHFVPPSLLLIN